MMIKDKPSVGVAARVFKAVTLDIVYATTAHEGLLPCLDRY
jgi:hypothetical protein